MRMGIARDHDDLRAVDEVMWDVDIICCRTTTSPIKEFSLTELIVRASMPVG